ncbi:hypothetical protein SLOPH_1025 [Spraguea lophii 42_110]|uniref:Uncharacterized protein n=1 Tax=Spraguea lophii (strain 42_110) TaxID=1358809 RepID=S7W7C8_SPRLO|nr:hypothetical protein SLOPH_1025 [Spraguea lophii 42_110]
MKLSKILCFIMNFFMFFDITLQTGSITTPTRPKQIPLTATPTTNEQAPANKQVQPTTTPEPTPVPARPKKRRAPQPPQQIPPAKPANEQVPANNQVHPTTSAPTPISTPTPNEQPTTPAPTPVSATTPNEPATINEQTPTTNEQTGKENGFGDKSFWIVSVQIILSALIIYS